ncbi:zinc ribbon domain-containing protein [Salinimonas sp. HHU 13199]|uniref:Zinc ribbon domain-containing protein n=1 Tax=Salinimonas profundi TaxID=2729140 RepID=A0ABR8LH35_9ALTE|nr:zinc ribbon domain-containing protein [Salinimonas profundi]MBD3585572.1 zinc ribbon domain-containing protein [Salinimonas profundi]
MNAKRSAKLYRCPDCRYVFSVDTSHFFSIFDNCPQCHSNTPKRCLEPEAIALTHRARESHPIIKTRVIAFTGNQAFNKATFSASHSFITTLPASDHLRQKNPVVSGEVWLETSTLHSRS